MSVSDVLLGSRVRRVASLGTRVLLLELAAPKGTLLCSVERGAQGIGWLDQGARELASEPAPWVTTVRSLLEGAALAGFERIGLRVTRLELTRGSERFWLVLEWSRGGAFALTRAAADENEPQVLLQVGRVQLDASEPVQSYEPAATLDELRADGARLAPALAAIELDAKTQALAKRLRTEAERRKRRMVAIEQDAARVVDAQALRAQASLVLANLYALPSNAAEVELDDFATDPPTKRRVKLDPALGPSAQCDAWFKRARKLERGAVLAKERAASTEHEIIAIEALLERVVAATEVAQLTALAEEARRFGIAASTATEAPKAKPAARVPYREFRGTGDRAIYVGRGAADNDALTLRHAKPHDLWLHARDESGAHVVVPLARNESCPPELLCDAATLAAHFSSARGSDRADIIYTPRRYVQKPRKSATGSVQVLREKVFRLQLEPARLKRLLDQEHAP